MIYVDTGVWFARYVRGDVDHPTAKNWFAQSSDRRVTTDYVVDELLTLLKSRGHADVAFRVGGNLLGGAICPLVHVQSCDLDRARAVFSTYRDKDWSFTDCVSRAVMERLGVTTAASFDDHFRQFGNIVVVP